MATESSAINDLIALAGARPVARDSADELLFEAPPAMRRAAKGTRPPPFRMVTAPPIRPMPVLAPAFGGVRAPLGEAMPAPSQARARRSLRSLAIPGSAMILVGVLIGGYLGLRGGHDHATAAVAAAVAPAAPRAVIPAPVAATVVVPVPEPAPAPAPVPVAPAAAVVPPAAATAIVRIESAPPGATVTIAGAGRSSFVGTTPIDATLERDRVVDLVFALDGHPRLVRTVDPATTREVSVVLEAPAPAPAPVPAPELAPHRRAHGHRHASAGDRGTLMISTKPPCSIVVDGRATALVTPQRAMSLPAGAHHITLVNSHEHVKKTIAVHIRARRATKVVRNFMPG